MGKWWSLCAWVCLACTDIPADDRRCSSSAIELDGVAPKERHVTCVRNTSCGPDIRLEFFDDDGTIGAFQYSEYMDPGHQEVVDLDGDGREELLVVGDSTGIEPRDLYIFAERDGEIVDLVAGECGVDFAKCGVDYLVVDLEEDGRSEIVAFAYDLEEQVHFYRVLRFDGERYRVAPLSEPSLSCASSGDS